MSFEIRGQFEDDFPIHFEPNLIFIGREQQIDLFHIYFNRWKKNIFKSSQVKDFALTPPSPDDRIQGFVSLLYGRGGFGKSTLIRYFRSMIQSENSNPLFSKTEISKIIDWEFAISDKRGLFNLAPYQEIDAIEYYRIICRELAIALGKTPQDFKDYQASVKDVSKIRRKASDILDSMHKEDHYPWLRGLTVDALMTLIRSHIPGSSIVLDNPNVKLAVNETARLTQEQIMQLHSRMHDKLGSKFGDYLEAPVQLGLALGRDLQSFSKNFPLLIFFDTYEEIDEGDQLLRVIMGSAGIRVGWVIAGRDNLWAGTEQRKRSVANEYGYKDLVLPDRMLAIDFNAGGIGAFTITDVTDYFVQVREKIRYDPPLPKLTSKDIFDILDVTQGIPLAVRIAAGIYIETASVKSITEEVNGKRKIIDEMIQRYLIHVHADQRERLQLYGLALVRRPSQPSTVATAIGLTTESSKNNYMSELSHLHRRYSFIFTEKELPSLHEEVRYYLRLWLLEHRTEPEIVAVNERLKESHVSSLKEQEKRKAYSSLRSRLEDEEWVSIYLDIAEQAFWLESSEGVDYLLPFMLAASIYLPNASQDIKEIGKFFERTFSQQHLKYWKWADQGLTYNPDRNPSKDQLTSLQELIKLAEQQHYPRFPSKLLQEDYQKEVEALLWWKFGEIYQGNDDEKAYKWYEKALDRLEQEPELRRVTSDTAHIMGDDLVDKERYLEAKVFLNRAITLQPSSSYIYSDRGNVYRILEDYQQAIADYDLAIKLNPSHSHFYLNRGSAYLELEDYPRALTNFNQAIKLEPKHADGYHMRGLVYFELEDYPRALTDYNQVIKLEPKHAEGYSLRGQIYSKLEDYQKALADYDQCIKLDPTRYGAYNNRGIVYCQLKNYQKAIADFDRAIEINPTYGGSYLNRGMLYHKLKNYQMALIDCNRAVELDSELTHNGLTEKGSILQDLGVHQEAVEAFIEALKAEPACSYCWRHLLKSLRILRPFEDPSSLFKNFTLPKDNKAIVLLARAEGLKMLGEYQEALANIDRAIEIDKTLLDKESNERGLLFSYLGKYVEAIENYERILKQDPNDYAALYNRAVAMVRWKGLDQSQKYFDVAYASLQKLINSGKYIALYGLGGLKALVGETELALDYLQQAIQHGEDVASWSLHDIAWLDLHSDPRFQSLIQASEELNSSEKHL